MANAPDTLIVTGPNNQQVSVDSIMVTPPGGSQGSLANFLNGGTVAAGGALSVFGSITPTGSTEATGASISSLTTVLGTAASTTWAVLPPSASVIGQQMLIINQGTAAVHIGAQGGDTIDNTAGTTGVTLTNAHRCFFVSTGAGTYVSGPEGGVTS